MSFNKRSVLFLRFLFILLALFLVNIFIFGVTVQAEEPLNRFVIGDFNNDASITVADAILLLREFLTPSNLLEENVELWQRGDVNFDGELSVVDAIKILQHIVGKITAFQPVENPVVFTENALIHILEQTDRQNVSLARDIVITRENLAINRDIIINGDPASGNNKNTTFYGEVVVAGVVENFTTRNIDIETLTLNGGGSESVVLKSTNIDDLTVNAEVTVRIDPDSKITRAVFNNDAIVSGGKNIINAYIDASAEVYFGNKYDRPVYEASEIKIITQPSTATSGDEISPVPTVGIVDNSGNPVEISGIAINLSLDAGQFTAGETSALTSAEGLVQFPGLIIQEIGSYKMIFKNDGLIEAVSEEFQINHSNINPLKSEIIINTCSEVIAASDNIDLTLKIADEFENPIDGFFHVFIGYIDDPWFDSSILQAEETAVEFIEGTVHIMASRTKAGIYENIPVKVDSVSIGTINITVTNAAPLFIVLQQPSDTIAGNPMDVNPAVLVEDEFGNIYHGVEIRLRINKIIGFHSHTITDQDGIAVFEEKEINITKADKYCLMFSIFLEKKIVEKSSEEFEVTAASAVSLLIKKEPEGSNENTGAVGTVEIITVDRFENQSVTGLDESLVVTAELSEGCFTPDSVAVVEINPFAGNGFIVFDNLFIDKPEESAFLSLAFSAPGLHPVESGPFSVD